MTKHPVPPNLTILDRVADEGGEEESLLNRMVLGELLQSLDKKQREIIVRRYFYNQTQTQIAGVLGISQVQVSRMERKILCEMRDQLKEEGGEKRDNGNKKGGGNKKGDSIHTIPTK